jgi:hypothetical protein
MIRTVCSSFLFLFPIYLSYVLRDTLGLFMFSIAMGMSIANHSHSFHPNKNRRELFKRMDIVYIHAMSIYIFLHAFYKFNTMFVLFMGILNYSVYLQLGERSIEYYSSYEKKVHVFFHFIGVFTLTFIRYY